MKTKLINFIKNNWKIFIFSGIIAILVSLMFSSCKKDEKVLPSKTTVQPIITTTQPINIIGTTWTCNLTGAFAGVSTASIDTTTTGIYEFTGPFKHIWKLQVIRTGKYLDVIADPDDIRGVNTIQDSLGNMHSGIITNANNIIINVEQEGNS